MSELREGLERSVDPILTREGFVRVHDNATECTYCAPWSNSAISHFLYIFMGPRGQNVLQGSFGIRNEISEVFSCNCIRAHGGEVFATFKDRPPTSCTMRFSLTRLEPAHWPISLGDITDEQLAKVLRELIKERLVPALASITTLERLLSVLAADMPCCPWLGTNGAIRAAQIVALAGQIGLDGNQTRSLLEPRKQLISGGMSPSSESRNNPTIYIDQIFADWAASAFGKRQL
jgi:hypothetical protein